MNRRKSRKYFLTYKVDKTCWCEKNQTLLATGINWIWEADAIFHYDYIKMTEKGIYFDL